MKAGSILLFFLYTSLAFSGEPKAILERDLNYALDVSHLQDGDFQYYYALLKLNEEKKKFENLFQDHSETAVEDLLRVFLPLDTKKFWDPKEGNFLAIAKVSHLLPVSLKDLSQEKLTQLEYMKKTLPRYSVEKLGENSFHVGGSLLTPDFTVSVTFLDPQHPEVKAIPLIDELKLRSGKIKVSLMHQEKFGRVFFMRTAKASSALIIYEDMGPEKTLVTQYILSNIINAPPARDLIRKGMVENLSDVVRGSREGMFKR